MSRFSAPQEPQMSGERRGAPQRLPKDYARAKRGLYAEYARSYDTDRREIYGDEALARWNNFLTQGISPGESILDAGCGTGTHLLRASRLVGPGGTCTGLDISPEMLSRAQRRLRLNRHLIKIALTGEPAKTQFTLADLSRTIPLPAGLYDRILCANLLEELPDLEHCVHDLVRLLRPGGTLAIAILCYSAENMATSSYVAAAAIRGWYYRADAEVLALLARSPGLCADSIQLSRDPVPALPGGKPRFPLFADLIAGVREAGLRAEEVSLEMLLVQVRKA